MAFGSFVKGIAGLAGAGGGSESEPLITGGYEALPEFVKEVYEDTYIPDVKKYYSSPFHNVPMVRSEYFEQDPMFASKSASMMQDYSDAIGGLFSPFIDEVTGEPVNSDGSNVMTEEQAANSSLGRDKIREMLNATKGDFRMAMGLPSARS